MRVISKVTFLITPLITTHEPPSQHQVATTGKLGSSESIVAKGLKYKEVPPNFSPKRMKPE